MKTTWIPSFLSAPLSLFTRDIPPPLGPIPPRLPCSGDLCHSVQALPPRFFSSLNPERYKVGYGPLTISAHNNNSSYGQQRTQGKNYFYFNSAPPCTDCFITNIQADLEYITNGGISSTVGTNVDTGGGRGGRGGGYYLHHLVVGNLERDSVTCPLNFEPILVSGSERRSEAQLSVNGSLRAGYYIGETGLLVFSAEVDTDLMIPGENHGRDDDDALLLLLTVDWEWVPASSAEGFGKLTPVWFDIDGVCSLRGGEVPVSMERPEVGLKMDPVWRADFAGDLVWIGGHLDDGGETLEVTRNGTVVCEMRAGYEGAEGSLEVGSGRGNDGSYGPGVVEPAKEHLSSMSSCALLGRMEVGDEWGLTANYNLTKHKPTEERSASGQLALVMGVALMYVVRDGQS
ncbi:hypothetical protein QBC43DRAFT_18303 [Cladorrhinum sp. PSN259]|nr:hypothetical protein QBC43DRAFT_18303 [Cladorrhinum sp. PSN259]